MQCSISMSTKYNATQYYYAYGIQCNAVLVWVQATLQCCISMSTGYNAILACLQDTMRYDQRLQSRNQVSTGFNTLFDWVGCDSVMQCL